MQPTESIPATCSWRWNISFSQPMKATSLHIAPNTLHTAAKRVKTLTLLLFTGALFALSAAAPVTLQAQHIGFGLSFAEGITLTNKGSVFRHDGELNFNRLLSPPVLLAGADPVTVSLTSLTEGVVIIAIDAPARADVTITVTAPAGNELILDEENGIDFQIGWAYWNLGSAGADLNAVLQQSDFGNAQEVVSATGINIPFMSATFPMVRSANRSSSSGSPLPPPDPNYAGRPELTDADMARAFVLVYGTLGEVPSGAQVGLYTGTIDIHAELSTY